MPNAKDLASAYFSGALLGKKPAGTTSSRGAQIEYLNKVNPSGTNSRGTAGGSSFGNMGVTGSSISGYNQTQGGTPFDTDAYTAAQKAGYTNNDINAFLQNTGVKAQGSQFQVGGLGTYGGQQTTYWQVTPDYKPPTTTGDPGPQKVAPDYGNKILKTIDLPNNGVGTIEFVKPLPPQVSTPAPILGDPLGENSQRVSRQKARLSIAA